MEELQKFINVDSYGKCLNNKPLPTQLVDFLCLSLTMLMGNNFAKSLEDPAEAMNHEDFLRLMAQYKFTLALENAVGDDYITEKLWRPLIVGSVPIYLGSPSVKASLETT